MQIDNFFESEATIPLYHYTGIGSLLGIAKTNSLWASSISYLNDSKEILDACEIVGKCVSELLDSIQCDKEKKFLIQLGEWTNLSKIKAHTIFIFSLSEERSLLSQWRSYTPHGKGVSLGFAPEKLNSIVQSSGLKLARCVYQREDQKNVVSELIQNLLARFRQELPSIDVSKKHPTQCYHGFFEEYANEIFQVMAIIKHSAFKEEKEWRLISEYHPSYTDGKILFREGASMLVPYIEILLGGSKPYFESVTLGPSPHQNLSMSGLSMFISKEELCNHTINCTIPYREW